MKKILMIARTCPYPTTDGEKVRVYNILRELSKKYKITLIYRRIFDGEKQYRTELEKYCDEVFDVFVPPPRNNWQRVWMIIRSLFSCYPIFVSPYYFRSLSNKIKSLTSEKKYDAVQIEHIFLFPYLDSIRMANSYTKIIILHNLEFIRLRRMYENMSISLGKLYMFVLQRRIKKHELSVLKRFDHIIVMSDSDKEQLCANYVKNNIVVIPNGVDTHSIKPTVGPCEKKTLLFVASLDYEPNQDGILWFLDTVYPLLIKEDPEFKLYIVGKNPDEKIKKYHSDKIVVTGTVDSVEKYYKLASVCIVPLRSGGGTRLKIFEALAYGIPTVSTTIGCEGISVANGKTILIADSPEDFANGIRRLMKDKQLWLDISKNGRELVEDMYAWDKIVVKYSEVI